MGIYFDKITDLNALYRAFKMCRIDTDWKESVQRYEANLFTNLRQLQRKLLDGTYRQLPFVEFELNERGRRRHIKSMHISDRVVQRALCDEVLAPALSKHLCYDNSASIKNKGVGFARKRMQCHLGRYIRKHGTDGYILKVDFSKFFDNIDHEIALKQVADRIDDPLLLALIEKLIASFRIGVTEEDYHYYQDRPINLLKLNPVKDSKWVLRRSLGIGSQLSQIFGVVFPAPIDHHIKVTRRCKYFGRYMDDFYVIHHDKSFLKQLLIEIKAIAKDLKLFVNDKKTSITPLKRGFTYLKVRYDITPSGKVTKRLTPDSFTRERRRLKKYRKFVNKTMTYREVSNAYQSWRGMATKFKTHRSVRKMDQLYTQLFVEGD